MHLQVFDRVQDFLKVTQKTLEANESANNLILGISFQLRDDPTRYQDPPFLAAVLDDQDQVALGAVMTGRFPVILQSDSNSEEAVRLLVTHLIKKVIYISGVNGQAVLSDLFTRLWSAHTGQSYHLSTALRTYELREVSLPPLPPGKFRMADPQDLETLKAWYLAFQFESVSQETRSTDASHIIRAVEHETVFVWEVEDRLVSMALLTRPTVHAITVSGVYTPPAERNRGYASACVATLSRYCLDAGYSYVNLFTDLANSTSNAIYQRIGYRPVCDYHQVSFNL